MIKLGTQEWTSKKFWKKKKHGPEKFYYVKVYYNHAEISHWPMLQDLKALYHLS